MLIATRTRLSAGSNYTVQRLAGYTAVHFGWGRGCYTNRSMGVCILLGKRFQPRMIKEVSFLSSFTGWTRRCDGFGHLGVLLAPFWWMQRCSTEGSNDGFSTIDGLDGNSSFELAEQSFHDCSGEPELYTEHTPVACKTNTSVLWLKMS